MHEENYSIKLQYMCSPLSIFTSFYKLLLKWEIDHVSFAEG